MSIFPSSVHPVDFIIVALYLGITLIWGIYSGLGKKVGHTLKDYAVGDRNFSTPALVATVAASWIGGKDILGTTEKVFDHGLILIIVCLGIATGIYLSKVLLLKNVFIFKRNVYLWVIS